MLIVLVLGAGTDYGLFLVFRVRENLREGADPNDAVRSAVTRVGETITFSALTVSAALLSLLVATFQIYSQLGIPLAIGIGTMLLAGLTLLPALLAVFGRAAFWPSKTRAGTGKVGLRGRLATRIVHRPAVPLTIGVLVFGALASAVTAYTPGGFGGTISAPGRHGLGRGHQAAHQALPVQRGQPDQPDLQAVPAGLEQPRPGQRRGQPAHRERSFHRRHWAAEPGRGHADPGAVQVAARDAGGPPRAPAGPALGPGRRAGGPVRGLPGRRAVRQPRRRDDPVRDRAEGR
jgi:hypothetical protein